jgi:hypothetical protein
MISNGIINTLMLANPVKKLLLPIAQQRILLPLPEYNSDNLNLLKPQSFWCSNKCDSLMKCLKINNSNIKCIKDGSLINSIQSSTYNVFKMTYNLKIKNYSYSNVDSVVGVIGKAYYNEKLEKYHQEVDILLYSLRDIKLQNEYGFFIKTPKELIFFKNELMDINHIYTNIKLIDLDKMKKNSL